MNEGPLVQKSPNKPKVEEYTLHPEAERLARDLATDYAASLFLQGKVLASQQKANQVQSVHIEQARDIIFGGQRRGWDKELLLIFGSALVGAFIQGFITELSAGHKITTGIYVVLGFIGMLLIFFGLMKR